MRRFRYSEATLFLYINNPPALAGGFDYWYFFVFYMAD